MTSTALKIMPPPDLNPKEGKAPPGAPAAVAKGCTCPVHRNVGGNGLIKPDGNRSWYITLYCPVHSSFTKPED